jgi:pimeloyl-ACP methyl ester carboxylesterase
VIKAKVAAARYLPGPLYRQITLRFHADSLTSPYDGEGQVPWDRMRSLRFFQQNTPWRSYVNRAKAAFSANYLDRLDRIEVPTLLITPAHDTLIGEKAAAQMLQGIPDATEVVLERTGHMFRFSHPVTYAQAVEDFMASRFAARSTVSSGRP